MTSGQRVLAEFQLHQTTKMPYTQLKQRLDAGERIVLDGGTGTELERRGVPMNPDAWCGPTSVEHRATLEQVHLDYIAAGAEIITANTFASSRLMLEPAGLGERVAELNQAAVEAALNARERSGNSAIVVAGSLSHMAPVRPGTDRYFAQNEDASVLTDAFHELAEIHKAGGCDFILLEMMSHTQRTPLAVAAAKATGLPLWAGFSARRDEDSGKLTSYSQVHLPFEDSIAAVDPKAVDAVGLMHTNATLIAPGLELLRKRFACPLMAYPDSGYFKMPNWQFENILTPEDFLDYTRTWVTSGVQIIGGCCGLSPEHIEAIRFLRT